MVMVSLAEICTPPPPPPPVPPESPPAPPTQPPRIGWRSVPPFTLPPSAPAAERLEFPPAPPVPANAPPPPPPPEELLAIPAAPAPVAPQAEDEESLPPAPGVVPPPPALTSPSTTTSPNTARMTGRVPISRRVWLVSTRSPRMGSTTASMPLAPCVTTTTGGVGCPHQFWNGLVALGEESKVEVLQLNRCAGPNIAMGGGVKFAGA